MEHERKHHHHEGEGVRFLIAEPDDEQVETAILAAQEVLRLETETEQLRAHRIDGPR